MPARSKRPTSAGRGHQRPRTSERQPLATRERAIQLERAFLWFLALGQRGLLVGLALAVLIAFAAGTLEQRWKEQQLQQQVATQQAKLQATESLNVQLRSQLAANDPAGYRTWVETTARRQLNLGYPGETIYLVNWSATDQPTTPGR